MNTPKPPFPSASIAGSRARRGRREVLALVVGGFAAALAACRGGARADLGAGGGESSAGEGYGLVGTPVAGLLPTRFARAPVPGAGGDAPRASLVRWWTDGCAFCAGSLPAIESLRVRYAPRGLETIAVYHPKPPRRVRDADAVRAADALGYRGAVAVDEDWASLRRVWLDAGPRPATSVSLLLDRGGVVRFVHPGPELFPSADPAHADADRGYRDMERAIEAALPP